MIEEVPNLTVDFQVSEPIKITEKYLAMAVDGTFYSQTVGEKKPDTEMPLMPLHDDTLASKL